MIFQCNKYGQGRKTFQITIVGDFRSIFKIHNSYWIRLRLQSRKNNANSNLICFHILINRHGAWQRTKLNWQPTKNAQYRCSSLLASALVWSTKLRQTAVKFELTFIHQLSSHLKCYCNVHTHFTTRAITCDSAWEENINDIDWLKDHRLIVQCCFKSLESVWNKQRNCQWLQVPYDKIEHRQMWTTLK